MRAPASQHHYAIPQSERTAAHRPGSSVVHSLRAAATLASPPALALREVIHRLGQRNATGAARQALLDELLHAWASTAGMQNAQPSRVLVPGNPGMSAYVQKIIPVVEVLTGLRLQDIGLEPHQSANGAYTCTLTMALAIRIAHAFEALRHAVEAGIAQGDVLETSNPFFAHTMVGTAGHDRLRASAQSARIEGHEGNDRLWGGNGHDTVLGGSGNDRLYGGRGDDLVAGGDGNDTLRGGPGINILLGGTGNDALHGGSGPDTLDGGTGDDQLHGGSGDNIYVFGRGDGHDTAHACRDRRRNKCNTLQFKAGITHDDIALQRSNNDLTVLIGGSTDTFTAKDFFLPDGTINHAQSPLQYIAFENGTGWNTDAILQKLKVPNTAALQHAITPHHSHSTPQIHSHALVQALSVFMPQPYLTAPHPIALAQPESLLQSASFGHHF